MHADLDPDSGREPTTEATEDTDGAQAPHRSIYARMAVGAAMGTQFVGSTFGGLIVGAWLDGKYGLSPWGMLGGSVLGLIVGILGLIRIARRVG